MVVICLNCLLDNVYVQVHMLVTHDRPLTLAASGNIQLRCNSKCAFRKCWNAERAELTKSLEDSQFYSIVDHPY